MVVQARGLSWVAEPTGVGIAEVKPRIARVEIAAAVKYIVVF